MLSFALRFLCFRISWYRWLHLLTLLLAAKVSQTFLAFDDFVRFKDCWSGIVYKVPPLGFIQGLSHS